MITCCGIWLLIGYLINTQYMSVMLPIPEAFHTAADVWLFPTALGVIKEKH